MKTLVNTNEAREMVKTAIENNTTIFIHENGTTRFYGYTFETINNNGSWETAINFVSYNLDEKGQVEVKNKHTNDSRTFDNLKSKLAYGFNTISNSLDEIKLLSEEVWLYEKVKHQQTILLGLFA